MSDTKLIKVHTWNRKQLCWGRDIYAVDLNDRPIIGYIQYNMWQDETLGCDFSYLGTSPRGDPENFGEHVHICPTNTRSTLCGGLTDYEGLNGRFFSWPKATCPACQRIAKAHPEYLPHSIYEDPKTMVVSFEDAHA